jgi:DNA-directed RNA polymerase sigma subunit (sigma70/sigma32)
VSDQAPDLTSLSEEEQGVLNLMSGLVDGRRYTAPAVAVQFGLPDERIIEILHSVKRKLGPPPA